MRRPEREDEQKERNQVFFQTHEFLLDAAGSETRLARPMAGAKRVGGLSSRTLIGK
jgi:hypothetical protein